MASSLQDDPLDSQPHTNIIINGIPVFLDTSHVTDFKQFYQKHGICCLKAFLRTPKEAYVCFEYLSKGAANVVFKINRPDPSFKGPCFFFVHVKDGQRDATAIPYEDIANRVLRVSRGKAKHQTSEDIVKGFQQEVRPVFSPCGQSGMPAGRAILDFDLPFKPMKAPRRLGLKLEQDYSKHLMDLTRVALFSGVMAHLSSLTDPGTFEMARTNPEHFLKRSNVGILLPDMSPVPGISLTIEIKPKWLLQSPTAPADAVRCRTCAMQLAVPKKREEYICPLRLVNGGEPDLRVWARNIVAHHVGDTTPGDSQREQLVSSIADRLIHYFILGGGQELLQHLMFLQSQLDPIGIIRREQVPQLARGVFDRNIQLAMTLRDCSLFIIIPYAAESPITSKLADLDFKSSEKFDDWKEKEEMLLRDNVYTRETTDGPECWCSRPHDA